jgi:hypothetical protein
MTLVESLDQDIRIVIDTSIIVPVDEEAGFRIRGIQGCIYFRRQVVGSIIEG